MSADGYVNDGRPALVSGQAWNGPWLVAHRGARAEAPENTHAAFEAAIRRRVDGIELDVQLTADDVPVIFHDDTMSRIFKIDRPVSSLTYSELAGFDVGRWFSPAFKGEKIPTLESVIKRYADKTALLVEIKSPPQWSDRSEPRKKAALSVTRMIRGMVPVERMDRIFILSFDPVILETAHADAPVIQLVQNLHFPLGGKNIPKEGAEGVIAYGLALNRLTPGFIKRVHDHGRLVMAYSFNTAKAVDTALKLGVDVILTDDPGATAGHFKARVAL